MTDGTNDATAAGIHEYTVLNKFEGDPAPENLVERVHIENGEIIKVEKYEEGEIVSTEIVKEVE